MKKRVKVKYFGDVIGVGFRGFIEREAKRLGVYGWVRNVDREYVEAVFEGEEKSVDSLVENSRNPEWTFIDRVEVTHEEFLGEFKIFTRI